MTILAKTKKRASSVCSANQCGFGWSITDIPGRAATLWLIYFIPTPLPHSLWLNFPKYLSKICPSLSLSQSPFSASYQVLLGCPYSIIFYCTVLRGQGGSAPGVQTEVAQQLSVPWLTMLSASVFFFFFPLVKNIWGF